MPLHWQYWRITHFLFSKVWHSRRNASFNWPRCWQKKGLQWRSFLVPIVHNGRHLSYSTRHKGITSVDEVLILALALLLVSHFVITSLFHFLVTCRHNCSSPIFSMRYKNVRLTFCFKIFKQLMIIIFTYYLLYECNKISGEIRNYFPNSVIKEMLNSRFSLISFNIVTNLVGWFIIHSDGIGNYLIIIINPNNSQDY